MLEKEKTARQFLNQDTQLSIVERKKWVGRVLQLNSDDIDWDKFFGERNSMRGKWELYTLLQQYYNNQLVEAFENNNNNNSVTIKIEKQRELYWELINCYSKQVSKKMPEKENILEKKILQTIRSNWYDFVLKNTINGVIEIPQERLLDFFVLLTKFQQYEIKNTYTKKWEIIHLDWLHEIWLYHNDWEENYYMAQIRKWIFMGKKEKISQSEQHIMIKKIKVAYGLIKRLFKGEIRKEKIPGKERNKGAFVHLSRVMNNVLKYSSEDTSSKTLVDRVLIALLHDVLEDIPGFPKEFIVKLFWQHVADCVWAMTKPDWKDYLEEEEKVMIDEWLKEKNNERYKKIRSQVKRKSNIKYYNKIKNLPKEWLDDALFVKLCDRIDNLDSLDELGRKHKTRKIRETKQYFLTDSVKNNYPILYEKLDELVKKAINSMKRPDQLQEGGDLYVVCPDLLWCDNSSDQNRD